MHISEKWIQRTEKSIIQILEQILMKISWCSVVHKQHFHYFVIFVWENMKIRVSSFSRSTSGKCLVVSALCSLQVPADLQPTSWKPSFNGDEDKLFFVQVFREQISCGKPPRFHLQQSAASVVFCHLCQTNQRKLFQRVWAGLGLGSASSASGEETNSLRRCSRCLQVE